MDWGAIINTAGLTVGMVGAGLIWRFGLPAKVDRDGHQHLILEQVDDEEKEKGRRYDKRSGVGFALLILGFLIQAISNFI